MLYVLVLNWTLLQVGVAVLLGMARRETAENVQQTMDHLSLPLLAFSILVTTCDMHMRICACVRVCSRTVACVYTHTCVCVCVCACARTPHGQTTLLQKRHVSMMPQSK